MYTLNEIPNLAKTAPAIIYLQDGVSYRPMTATDLSNTVISGANITAVNSGTYSSVIFQITSGQSSIPVGAKSWSIFVESGNGAVNGISVTAGMSLAGGGLGLSTLSSSINYGITGGRIVGLYDI